MPVLGLVVTLDDRDPKTHAHVAVGLRAAPGLELGEAAGHRWPVVLESASPAEAEARIDALRRVTGIANVDVVYADFEDMTARGPTGRTREGT